jgi:16S rRNA (cytosine967-C5)-methyltransferase
MNKLFKNLVDPVALALENILVNQANISLTVDTMIRNNPKWGKRDREFINQCIHEVVRYARLYTHVLEAEDFENTNWYQAIGLWWLDKGNELPDWPEWAHLDKEQLQKRFAACREHEDLKESFPEWLHRRGSETLGDKWPTIMQGLNQPTDIVLRVNTLQAGVGSVMEKLMELGYDVEHVGKTGIKVKSRIQIGKLQLFHDGIVEVQDAASQAVSEYLEVKPGEKVIDACAGAGGKSLHLAALMKNKGSIISMDVHVEKLKELMRRSERAGVRVIQTSMFNETVVDYLTDSADAVLLDVPCSGTGTIRRRPNLKWELEESFLDNRIALQQKLLQSYAGFCKPGGGRLVYATCSILPEENEDQVMEFLASEAGQEFELTKSQTLYPQEFGYDGFYMAMLTRK